MAERLRVLQVGKYYPPHLGGMESHLEALCGALKGEVDLRVVVSADGRGTVRETVDGIPVARVATYATVASAPFNPGMAREIAARADDVVHLHHPNPTATLSYLASGHRGALVVTYHSDIVRQRVLGAAFRPVLDRLLGRAAAILVSSPPLLASSAPLRAHAARCRVVPFGVPPAVFDPPDPKVVEELRSRYGPGMVLAVGRLVYYKGFEYLVRAMKDVPGRLVLVGNGPLRGPLESLARDAGVADRVHFAGSVPDLRPWLHAADVFALPSVARSEAFAIVQLEAMAAGLPVVNTSLDTGVPWVSPHGVTGATVPPRDAQALAAALAGLLAAPGARARHGAAGRDRVRRHFSLDGMARAVLQSYHDAAAGAPPGAADSPRNASR